MTNATPLETARAQLAIVWFCGSGIVFIILVGQSLGGLFSGQVEKVWAWASPNIVPTLSLMISVFASYALIPQSVEDKYTVRKNFLKISVALSAFYIMNVIIVIVSAPFVVRYAGGDVKNPIDVLHMSNFWLAPLQGLTVAALVALFFTKTENETSSTTTASHLVR